jgi:hypothetical protein
MKAVGIILLIAGIALNVLILMKNPGGMLNWMPSMSETMLWCLRIGLVVLGLVLLMAGRKKA